MNPTAITILTGRIRNVEEKKTTNGKDLVKFTLVTRDWNPVEKKEVPSYHNCVAFGNTGSFLVKFGDDRFAVVVGTAKVRAYIDKKTGEAKAVSELIADGIRLIGPDLKSRANNALADERDRNDVPADGLPDEDIPF